MTRSQARAHVGPLILALVMPLLVSFTSHFAVLNNGSKGHDAGVFATVGYGIGNGRALYTEIWDNKGPLLYLINWAGVSLDYRHGIYLMELVALAVAAVVAYRTGLVVTGQNRWMSALATAFAMELLVVTFEGGNLSEEYALPFMCVAMYYMARWFTEGHRLRAWQGALIGLSAAGCFWMRANLVAIFGAMAIVVVVVTLKSRQFGALGRWLGQVVAGGVLGSLPLVAYLALTGSLRACIDQVYLGGLSDFNPLPRRTVLANVFTMIRVSAETGTLFAALAFIVALVVVWRRPILDRPGIRPILMTCAVGLVVNLVANSLSGSANMHYFTTFVPIMVAPLAWLFDSAQRALMPVTPDQTVRGLVVGLAVLALGFGGCLKLGDMIVNNLTLQAPNRVVAWIDDNSQPSDLVQAVGGDVTLNYQAKRLPASRHINYNLGEFSDQAKGRISDEIAADIIAQHPKLIIFAQSDFGRFTGLLSDQSGFVEELANYYVLQDNDAAGLPAEYTAYKLK